MVTTNCLRTCGEPTGNGGSAINNHQLRRNGRRGLLRLLHPLRLLRLSAESHGMDAAIPATAVASAGARTAHNHQGGTGRVKQLAPAQVRLHHLTRLRGGWGRAGAMKGRGHGRAAAGQ